MDELERYVRRLEGQVEHQRQELVNVRKRNKQMKEEIRRLNWLGRGVVEEADMCRVETTGRLLGLMNDPREQKTPVPTVEQMIVLLRYRLSETQRAALREMLQDRTFRAAIIGGLK